MATVPTPFDALFNEGGVPGLDQIAGLLAAPAAPQPLIPPGQPPAATFDAGQPPVPQIDTTGLPNVPGITLDRRPPVSPTDLGIPAMTTPPAARAPGNYDWTAIERSIDSIESGGTPTSIGRWGQVGPTITNRNSQYFGDRAYGRFQVMGRDIPELTRQYYGTALTPQQFLENQEAQTAVFRGRFGEYITRFGNPVDAAQAWFAGPGSVGDAGSMDRSDAQAGFRGTTVRGYRNMFASALSRYTSGQPTGGDGGNFTTMEVSPDMAAALGSPTTTMPVPGAFSPRGAAMAPGIAAAGGGAPITAPATAGVGGPMQLANAPALPGNVARPGWLGILDQLGLATPGFAGTRPTPEGGFTPYGAWFDQMPVAQQQAAAAIYRRGQEIQAANPGWAPQQVAQALLRDPVFGQNAAYVGTNAPALLQAASQPAIPPTIMAGPPGTQFYQQQGGQISPTGVGTPATAPAEVQLLERYMQAQPAERAAILDFMQQRRASDREQAIARIQASEAAGQTPSQHDLQLAGYIRVVPRMNQYGQVIGQDVINTYRPGQPPPAVPSTSYGGGAVTPPATVAPGGGVGAPETVPVTPPAGAVGAPSTPTGAPGQPPALRTAPRVIGRRTDGRDVVDVPDLALSTTLIPNSAHMVLGAGPVASFLGAWGRVVGNVIPGTEEEVQARQSLLDQFRAAYSTYIKGSRLAGEHEVAMRAVPQSGEIFTNPLRAVNQFIGLREGLVRELQLATQQAGDQSLDERTRKTASDRVAEIQSLLLRMPNQQSLYELSDQLRTGARIAGINISEATAHVGEAVGVAERAAKTVTGGGQSAIPADLSNMSLDDLRRLSHRRGLSNPDRQRIIDAITTLQTGRPAVPRSY